MGGGGKPPPYMVRYFVAPDDSAGAKAAARPVVAPYVVRISVGPHSVRPRAAAQKRRKNFIKFSETPEKHLTSRQEYVTIRLHLVTKSELTI